MRADLHIHTTASDGCWLPERVVAEVKARSIGLFAITDHNSIDNVAPVEALVHDAGLAFLCGVETYTHLNGRQFHILGYGVELDNPTLNAHLRESRSKLSQAGERMVRNLLAAGYPVDVNDYLAYEHDRTRGAWKVHHYLIDCGVCKDIDECFANPDIKAPSRLCQFPHPEKVIAVIREAGGVPILAHPAASLRKTGLTDAALQPLLDAGIAGLECYYANHDEAETRFCLDWCARHDLITTAGSDCHGGFLNRELGHPPTDTVDLQLGELKDKIIYQGPAKE